MSLQEKLRQLQKGISWLPGFGFAIIQKIDHPHLNAAMTGCPANDSEILFFHLQEPAEYF